MERKFYTDDFEQLLKEKSDEFRMYPSKRVWHSIYNDLHPGRKWPSVAVTMLLIIALLMVGYWNNNSSETITASNASGQTNNIGLVAVSNAVIADNNNTTPFFPSPTYSTYSNGAKIPGQMPIKNNRESNFNKTAQTNASTATNSNVLITDNMPSTVNNNATKLFQQFIVQLSNNNADDINTNTGVSGNLPEDGISQMGTLSTFTYSGKNAADDQISVPAAPKNANPVQWINVNPVNNTSGTTTNNISKEFVFINAPEDLNEKELNAVNTNAVAKNNSQLRKNNKALVSGGFKIWKPSASASVTAHLTGNINEAIAVADNNTDGAVDEVASALQSSPVTPVNPIAEKDAGVSNITKTTKAVEATTTAVKKTTAEDDKAWIEDYAFHNKSKRKKWQDRTALEFYITPGVGYAKIDNDPRYNIPGSSPSFTTVAASGDASKSIGRKPVLGLEAGFAINYTLAKKIRVKAGVQVNYTSYGINADETNHPVLTTLMLIDPNSGFPYMHSATSTLANSSGYQPVKIHNKTYQVSIPVGFAFKLSGNDKLEWYAGATLQPTFVFGGKAYLISADRKNYVADASLIRKWNLNTGIETYINYKFDGFTLQAGPQFRYQLLSTYYKRYTVNENLSNVGIKLGILKNF